MSNVTVSDCEKALHVSMALVNVNVPLDYKQSLSLGIVKVREIHEGVASSRKWQFSRAIACITRFTIPKKNEGLFVV